LHELERDCCGAPAGMPIRARSVFGRILASMTTEERTNVQQECTWSKRSDIPDAHAITTRSNEQVPESSLSSLSSLSSKKQRRRRRKQAEQNGTQYGKSRHATEDDNMWGLVSDTIVLKGPSSTAPVLKGRRSLSKNRPSTAPSNPFRGEYKSPPKIRGRLNVGVCSPSFYGRRRDSNSGGKLQVLAKRPSTAAVHKPTLK
jgi:hypothetical protein|tara:strand:+ start:549 stop:1151 length:603 start_codon:yes stop_codon:yes gene_type:complete